MEIILEEFLQKFKFSRKRAGFVGVEREQFTIDPTTHNIIPASQRYLEYLHGRNDGSDLINFGYELSACQLETKIGPCALSDLGTLLYEAERYLERVDEVLGVTRTNLEVAPPHMPLDIYPDPTGRYQVITQHMPQDILSAACRVAATHIHVGMPDLDTAIVVYNRVIAKISKFIVLAGPSNALRVELYRLMAKRYMPEPILSKEDFFAQAQTHGFDKDPRSCWSFIRISVHGTLEFRMFGATEELSQICDWAQSCHDACWL